MKSIFKFMTVALAAGLVVSCSDELNLEKKAYTAQEGDLVGTLYAPAPTRVAMLDVLTSDGYDPVWSTGDEVNVFSSTQLNFNQYILASGEGTPKGIFEPVETNPALLGATDLYAITEASYQYGVSAIDANSGKVKLTAEIPTAFDWEKLATAEAYALPSPFWGHASFGDDGLLNVGFKPLTGLLRLDLAYLPEGVNSIILVTGNSTYPGATYTVGAVDEDGNPVEKSKVEYQGSSEGISGFFNTILDYNDVVNYEPLHYDRALVCNDTLRVDFPEATKFDDDKVLFIPLIANHYDNLKVIAVIADDAAPYTWYGEILRTFDDITVANGECKDVNMTANYLLTATTPLAISEEIARLYDGKHSLVVSAPLVETSEKDNVIYITSDDPDKVGQTSVTINIGTIDGDELNFAEAGTGNDIGLGVHTFHGFETRYTVYDPAKAVSAKKERTVTLNFSEAPEDIEVMNICLPSSNVVMSAAINSATTSATTTETEGDAEESELEFMPTINIITALTENVSGRDATMADQEDAAYNNTVSNEQNAGLKFTGQYSVVNYYTGGAVYFLDVPEVNAQQSEIKESLNIFGENPKSLRITDALINTITYPEISLSDQGNNVTAYIVTTGSAAIKKLQEPGDKVKIQAYWTGKRLTPYSILNGYEGTQVCDDGYSDGETVFNNNYSIVRQGAIYTAAQLQGMGLSMGVYNYTISPKVESIWLGGIEYPWIGAQIKNHDAITLADGALANAEKLGSDDMAKISSKFTLDGRNVTLKNMILDIYDPTIELPGCCGTTQKIRLLKNLGLIRCILTSDESKDKVPAVEIKNIQLDDVYLNTGKYAIDNIGSLVGIISADGDVKIGGSIYEKAVSSFTDIRIQSKGNNIGGIVGELESSGKVTIDSVEVESIEKNNSYIHGSHIIGKNNVGGLVGRLTTDEYYIGKSAATSQDDIVELTVPEEHTFFIVNVWHYDAGSWYTTKKDGSYNNQFVASEIIPGRPWYNPATLPQALHTLWYIDQATGAAIQETADTPQSGVTYYRDKACTTEVGVFRIYETETTEYWCNGKKQTSLTGKLYTFTGEGTPTTAQLVSTETDKNNTYNGSSNPNFKKAGEPPYDWDNTDYYMVECTKKYAIETTPQGGDYPKALTVINAKVNLDNNTFDGVKKGIIKAEQGSNAGGLFGYVCMEGPATVEQKITVSVPTITATTTETRASLSAKATTYGNNAGGLLGNFQNVGKVEKIQSKFAGTVSARKGIVAESMRAGGLIGVQFTRMFTHASDHTSPAQVLVAANAGATINIGELTATNGVAGGVIGYQEQGKVEIASGADVTVSINKINAAYAAGGAIGESNDDALLAIKSKKLTATTGDMAITKDSKYFPSTEYRNYFGTFGTLVGEKNHWLEIDKQGGGNVTAKVAGGNLLTDAKKNALLFGLNGTAANTEEVPAGDKFWGDENGFLGHGKESSQYIVKGNVQQGHYDYNIFKEY